MLPIPDQVGPKRRVEVPQAFLKTGFYRLGSKGKITSSIAARSGLLGLIRSSNTWKAKGLGSEIWSVTAPTHADLEAGSNSTRAGSPHSAVWSIAPHSNPPPFRPAEKGRVGRKAAGTHRAVGKGHPAGPPQVVPSGLRSLWAEGLPTTWRKASVDGREALLGSALGGRRLHGTLAESARTLYVIPPPFSIAYIGILL